MVDIIFHYCLTPSGDYDIRVEQAEFSEISVVASGEAGATVSIVSYRTGAKVITQPSFEIAKDFFTPRKF